MRSTRFSTIEPFDNELRKPLEYGKWSIWTTSFFVLMTVRRHGYFSFLKNNRNFYFSFRQKKRWSKWTSSGSQRVKLTFLNSFLCPFWSLFRVRFWIQTGFYTIIKYFLLRPWLQFLTFVKVASLRPTAFPFFHKSSQLAEIDQKIISENWLFYI